MHRCRRAPSDPLRSIDAGEARSRRRRGVRLAAPVAALIAVLLSLAPPASSAASAPPEQTGSPETTVMRYGPITLPAAVAGRPGVVNALVPNLEMPCRDCFLTGVDIDMVFEDGRSANLDRGVMLHHVVVFNSGRPDATCAPTTPVGALGERFFAAGNERTSGDLPAGFGYHLGSDPVQGVVEIMNHNASPQVVYIEAVMAHAPGTSDLRAVTPVWLDQNNCRTSEYPVPAGPSHRVWRWSSTLTGRVVAAGGHVHDWGLRTVLFNETTGEHHCTSYAGYGTDRAYMGHIESMTTCIWDRIGVVREGDVLAIDTYYDAPEPRDDVMGIMLAYVYETDDLSAGTTPPPQAPPANNRPEGLRPGHHH